MACSEFHYCSNCDSTFPADSAEKAQTMEQCAEVLEKMLDVSQAKEASALAEVRNLENVIREQATTIAQIGSNAEMWRQSMYALESELSKRAATIERLRDALMETWQIASRFSVRPDARCHPDISYAQMNESAKIVMHTTSQQIAWEIKDFVDAALNPETAS